MVIDVNGNGSILFQSLDPTDNSLYTFSQNNTYVFVPVINLTIGNTANLGVINIYGNTVNVLANTFVLTSNSVTLNVGGSSMTIQKAKPPTLTILTNTANNGTITGQYNPPAGCVWIKLRIIAAGGAGTSVGGTVANGGANAWFGTVGNTNLWQCQAGNGGASIGGGLGGGTSANNGGIWFGQTGSSGGGSSTEVNIQGGDGGCSPFGGAGGGGGQGGRNPGALGTTMDATPSSGSGGGGSGWTSSGANAGGGGGGSGGYLEAYITSLANTYNYAVPQYTNGPQNGSFTGGAGGSGQIIIEEHYGF